METTRYSLDQRISWLSQRIELSDSDKNYIRMQMAEHANQAVELVIKNK